MVPPNANKPQDRRTKDWNEHGTDKFSFVDLFAGIGGFHQAMRALGGTCVMASEINQACVETYKLNFTTQEGDVRGDINKVLCFLHLCGGELNSLLLIVNSHFNFLSVLLALSVWSLP